MNKIYAALASIGLILSIIFGAFLKGRSSGKKQKEDEQKDEYIETVKKINEAKHDIPADNDNVHSLLRDKWSRD